MKTKILIPYLVMTIAACSNHVDNNIVKRYLDIEIPVESKLIDNQTDIAVGDLTEKYIWQLNDKQFESIKDKIRQSKYFVDSLPDSRPNDTTHYYWYSDNDYFKFITDNGNPNVVANLDINRKTLELQIIDE